MDPAVLLAANLVLSALALAGVVLLWLRRPEAPSLEPVERGLERVERTLRAELDRARGDAADGGRALREEVAGSLGQLSEDLRRTTILTADLLKDRLVWMTDQLNAMSATSQAGQDSLRRSVEGRLDALGADTLAKLEAMRATVDEKLQGTLERRLGESFALVSQRLEEVHRGLGEMQSLAVGVGDLKRVLSNVKVRGGWGEVQLGALLEQMLSTEQVVRNARPRPESQEVVEFAVRLPGRDGSTVLLPIDAKFPREDYERLVEAAERADAEAVELWTRALEQRVRTEARRLAQKYVNPPVTTDFALLFLPTEGLYAEVLRRPGLTDQLQQQFRVSVVGPTTLGALLNSLQMGFRTLAIEQRSAEVWAVLGAVKTEFQKFGDVIDKVRKKLGEASTAIDDVSTRTRAIDRRLRTVETIEAIEVAQLPSAVGADGN